MAWIFFFSFAVVLTHGFSLSLPILNNQQDCSINRAVKCISTHTSGDGGGLLLYTPTNTSYYALMDSFIQNTRFTKSPNSSWPALIISATKTAHVQASIICCKKHGLPIRVRSGGHDYEGLSYRSLRPSPFAMLDLSNLRTIDINLDESTARVEAGATLGELYYKIAERSMIHGFPAGNCPMVGVAGHVSGGGHGPLARKFGLASDQVVDANIVNVKGEVLDRESMGEDLFWAIRGGGGESFGVVLSWKLRLVPVPSTVTVFTITKPLELQVITKWQNLAYDLPDTLYLKLDIVATGIRHQRRRVAAVFKSLYLGRCREMLNILGSSFPELGASVNDCKEMSWIRSAMYFAGFKDEEPIESLLNREVQGKHFFKGKSDFLNEPIPWKGWKIILRNFLEEEGVGEMYIDPYGGKMKEINESDTPFPHRNGTVFNVQYVVNWKGGGDDEASKKHMDWIRDLYKEMSPFVSRDPRGAYLNYRDLDLGSNGEGDERSSYSAAMVWGVKYFKNNFEKLARVKGEVDPQNYFWNEQSIPPLPLLPGQISVKASDINLADE